MSPGAVALIVLGLGAVLAGFGFVLGTFLKRSYVPWVALGGTLAGIVWAPEAGGGIDPTRLAAAVNEARLALADNTRWTPEQIDKALAQAHIFVHAAPIWKYDATGAGAGFNVAGLQAGSTMNIGSDFAALNHEAAHMCQELIDGVVDLDHVAWADAGIWGAEAEYGRWLDAGTPASGTPAGTQ